MSILSFMIGIPLLERWFFYWKGHLVLFEQLSCFKFFFCVCVWIEATLDVLRWIFFNVNKLKVSGPFGRSCLTSWKMWSDQRQLVVCNWWRDSGRLMSDSVFSTVTADGLAALGDRSAGTGMNKFNMIGNSMYSVIGDLTYLQLNWCLTPR